MRSDSRVVGEFSLSLRGLDGWRWGQSIRCESTQATQEFLQHHRQLWRIAWRQVKHRNLLSIGIHLGRFELISERNGDLFRPLAPAETTKGEQLSAVLDQINMRFGVDTIRIGPNGPHYGFFERGRGDSRGLLITLEHV